MPHFPYPTTSVFSSPTAPDPETQQRWAESARRRRMLEGLWQHDLESYLEAEMPPERRRMQGQADLSSNLFRSLCVQMSVLYDRPPVLGHADDTAAALMQGITDEAGLWHLASRLQQLTIGCRECLLRLDVPPETGRLLPRIVPIDLVWADSFPHAPTIPHTIHEYRIRAVEGRQAWTRDVLSIRNPKNPIYQVQSQDGKLDLSEMFIGNLSGDAYPYRDSSGAPVLPAVLYHAEYGGGSGLFDPYQYREIVHGTLAIAAHLTQWSHVFRDCSWPQRWVLNAAIDGLTADPDSGETWVVTDPSSLLTFRPKIPGTSASIGQFAPGGDPSTMLDAIERRVQAIAAQFDLTPADVQRTHSSRSGYAISLSRAAQRRASRRHAWPFMRSDRATLRVIAILMNRATGAALPEDGWAIEYQGLPLSLDEKRVAMELYELRSKLGVTSRVQLLAALDGVSERVARERLSQIDIDNSGGAASGGGAPVDGAAQDTALNGAQVTAALAIVQAVAAQELTSSMAQAMLVEFFNLSTDAARDILAGVESIEPPATNQARSTT